MSKSTSHTLTPELFKAISEGHSRPLLNVIRMDHTLSLEFRGTKAIAYYRGGKLIELSMGKGGVLQCNGPTEGFNKSEHSKSVPRCLALPDTSSIDALIELIPQWKWRMDCSNKTKIEIEFTQLLTRENNWDLDNSDYIICDLEYAEKIHDGKRARFDAVGIGWPAGSIPVRRKGNPQTLVLFEAKYGLNAIGGSSAAKATHDDLLGHFESAQKFCSNVALVDSLRLQVVETFNQKLALGLLNKKKVKCDRLNAFATHGKEVPLELLFVLGGCTPKSQRVTNQLEAIASKLDEKSRAKTDAGPLQVNIATGGLMGYGLFASNVYGIREYLRK